MLISGATGEAQLAPLTGPAYTPTPFAQPQVPTPPETRTPPPGSPVPDFLHQDIPAGTTPSTPGAVTPDVLTQPPDLGGGY